MKNELKEFFSTKKIIIIIFCFLILYIIFPLLNFNNTIYGHDLLYHMMRIKVLANEIKNMNIPLFVSGLRFDGYGSADFLFYPYATMYIPAIIYILTNDLIISLNIYCITCIAVMAIIMYISSFEIYKNCKIALLSSILYTLSFYNLWDLYIRLSLGEILAMSFLPLLIAGVYNVLFSDKKHYYYIIIGYTMIAQSHIITTFYISVFLFVILILNIRKIFKDKELCKKIIISFTIIFLLNIGFYYPCIVSYIKEKNLGIYSYIPKSFDILSFFQFLERILLS